MKIINYALVPVLFLIMALLVLNNHPSAESTSKLTRLERIEKSGVLKCGYTIWPPAVMVDPNTGDLSGIFYDLMEEIGKQWGIDIEWTTEISPPQMFDDMNIGRYDMVCSAYLPSPARAKKGMFSASIFYNTLNLYVREDDARFDYKHDLANNPDVRFVATEGNIMSIVTSRKFPEATLIGLPEYSTPSDTFLHIETGKADILISEPLTYALYNKNNPDKIRRVKGEPLSLSGVSMPMPSKEYDFKYAIDTTLEFLQNTGFIDETLDKYEYEGGHLLRTIPLHEAFDPEN